MGPEIWTQLRQYPDRNIAWRAGQLSVAVADVSADRAAIVEELLPLAQQKGDVTKGKEVF